MHLESLTNHIFRLIDIIACCKKKKDGVWSDKKSQKDRTSCLWILCMTVNELPEQLKKKAKI